MVQYEWTLEEIQDGEIMDSDFADTLPLTWLTEPNTDLGLVRNEGSESEGVNDRLWAYVKDGKLPEYFSNAMGEVVGYKVPQKFHNELNKLTSNN